MLEVNSLSVRLPRPSGGSLSLVQDVSYAVRRGQTLAIVGESGSGKTMSCRALLGLLPRGSIVDGSIRFDGSERISSGSVDAKALRGHEIGMVFQNAASHLNPVRSIGAHLTTTLALAGLKDRKVRNREAIALLDEMMLPDPEVLMRRHPHELSGGQNQRAMIALALAAKPRLLIADEATTALDVLVQAQILSLLQRLSRNRGLAVILVTHDLGIAARQADSLCVIYRGQAVERAPNPGFFAAPNHPYSAALLATAPSLRQRLTDRRHPSGDRRVKGGALATAAAPLIEAKGIGHVYRQRRRLPWVTIAGRTAVENVDLRLYAGRTVALVGESGCGKTTLGRMIAGQLAVHTGTLERAKAGDVPLSRSVQYVSQDPLDALDPRLPVREQIVEPLNIHRMGDRAVRRALADAVLAEVGLQPEHGRALPAELSGGQAQRAVLARALVLSPQILVLDEPLSALDVSVQAHVLALLRSLQRSRAVAYLLITHDLRVVPALADEIIVLHSGRVVERGPSERVLHAPEHPYTKALIAAVPEIGDERGWPALADRPAWEPAA